VPSKVAEQGITQQIAEVEFLSECAAMQRLTGLVQPLPIHVTLQRTIASAVSELLHLGQFTRAIQEYVGGRMAVSGTLMLYVTLPDGVTMIQEDGDPFKLIRRGATAALSNFYPDRAIIVNFRRSLLTGFPTIAEVRQQIEAELVKTGEDAKYEVRSTTWTLRGAVAFLGSDEVDDRTCVDRRAHDVIPITHSVAHLNQDFLEITQRRTFQALADVEATRSDGGSA
jgi:hypothetical protein